MARARPAVAMAAAALAAALAGCGAGGTEITDTLAAVAPPAVAPPAGTPDGTVLPIPAKVRAAIVDPATGRLVLAATEPDRLLVVDLALLDQTAPGLTAPGLTASGLAAPDAPVRAVALPGAVDRLDLAGSDGQVFAPVRSAGVLLAVDVTSEAPTVRSTPVDGGPVAAAMVAGHTVVALADRPAVAVLDGDQVRHTVTGFAEPAGVVDAGGKVAVLDRLRSAVATLDAERGELGPSLRAGSGATNAVADRFGRVLVTDTTDGELLAFSAQPLIMRQRFPVPGAPYAIAYDSARDLAWITLTERNQVVGYHVAGGEPVERHRLDTVRQPNAVAVDPNSGAVVVGSGTGDGVQVVKP